MLGFLVPMFSAREKKNKHEKSRRILSMKPLTVINVNNFLRLANIQKRTKFSVNSFRFDVKPNEIKSASRRLQFARFAWKKRISMIQLFIIILLIKWNIL